jgi:lipoate synthase
MNVIKSKIMILIESYNNNLNNRVLQDLQLNMERFQILFKKEPDITLIKIDTINSKKKEIDKVKNNYNQTLKKISKLETENSYQERLLWVAFIIIGFLFIKTNK